MAIIVFAVGRPGSGKSTILRKIMNGLQQKGEDTHKNIKIAYRRDYAILLEMLNSEEHRDKFTINEFGGFDVVNFSVLDIALKELNTRITNELNNYDVIFVEFARDTYNKPFQIFNRELLKDAYFLFVEAALDTCIKRIHERVKNQDGLDHHFLSDEIMTRYYKQDQWSYMSDEFLQDLSKFCKNFTLKRDQLELVYNMDCLDKLDKTSEKLAKILSQKVSAEKVPAEKVLAQMVISR